MLTAHSFVAMLRARAGLLRELPAAIDADVSFALR
jgi:hypothetical protein